jgi:hypothetical protein
MVIPEFPDFREIDMSCQEDINAFLVRFPLDASEYTFTNIFAYRFTYNFKLSVLKNNLILLQDTEPVSAFCPVGTSQMEEVLEEVLHFLKGKTDEPYLERVPESFIQTYINDRGRFVAQEERDHFDYVHDVKELIELRGNKFHDKRNKVNRLRNLHEYEYITVTPDLIDECLEFEDFWCEVRECEKYYGLDKERCAILQMMYNFDSLNMTGGVIRIDGKIAALTLGERFLDDTIVIHVEKANADIPGLYQVINQEFLRHEAEGCLYVNREQDLGIDGLRKAKMSYNPVRFIKKYKVMIKN